MLTAEAPKTFDQFYLSKDVQQALKAIGYETSTPVQGAAIPLIMAGIDLIVQSQTGTGKTAAFAIPVIEMLEPSDKEGVDVLVLAPTRELAKQVSEEFEKLGKFKDVRSTAIYGRSEYGPQIEAAKRSQVVCATPGRLLDLLQRKDIDLSGLSHLILDEADEMLSMGFDRDVRAILDYIPEERQSLLFSATVTEDVKSLSKKILFHPEYISFSSDSVLNVNVSHTFIRVDGMGRSRDLARILEYEDPKTAIIFANTKADTFMVHRYLKRHGYPVGVLNGDMDQKDREKTLAKMRSGQIKILVATDVAARGIDIIDLSHVINFRLPDSPEVYVHRTGRTGRAGNTGKAISLVAGIDMAGFIQIQKHCDIEAVERGVPEPIEIAQVRRAREFEGFTGSLVESDSVVVKQYAALAQKLVDDAEGEELVTLVAQLIATVKARPVVTIAPEQEEEVEAKSKTKRDDKPRKESKPEAKKEVQAETKPEAKAKSPAPTPEDAKPAPKKEEPAQDEKSPEQEESKGRGRRGRRGRRRDDSSPQETQSETPAPQSAQPKAPEAPAAPKEAPAAKETKPAPAPEKPKTQRPKLTHRTQRMYVNLGRNIFKEDEDFIAFVLEMSGMDDEDFGRVSVERNHTLVEVRRDYLYDVIHALNNQEWDGRTITAKQARD